MWCSTLVENTAARPPSWTHPARHFAESHTPNMASLVERTARGFVAAGIKPGDMIGIFLPNCWEFGVVFHAATMAGAIPTTMNPTYRDREVHYQMEVSDAVALISDGASAARHRPCRLAGTAQGVHHTHLRLRRQRAIKQSLHPRRQ